MRWLQTIGLIVLLGSGSAAWGGPLRFGIILGNDEGHLRMHTLRYAQRDAQKMYTVLVEHGGFEPDHLNLLLGGSAEEALAALDSMEVRIQQATRNGEPALLVFYYSGHADGDVLEMGTSSLAFQDLKHRLERSSAKVRIAFVDSCRSGRLVSTRAGRRVPGFEIRLTDELESAGMAIVTSSAYDELSQESEEIRGSFFTHYLVSALRGAGDLSRDGRITLGEAYAYAYNRTVARTSRTVGGSQHPMYDYQLVGRGDVTLTRIDDNTASLAVASPRDGRLVVLDSHRDHMLAEAEVSAGQTQTLGMPPGSYRVYLLSRQQASMAEVEIRSKGAHRLEADSFVDVQLSRTVDKGGLFRGRFAHHLSAGFTLRRWPLADWSPAMGVAIQYRALAPSGWYPAVRLLVAASPDQGVATDNLGVGVLTGAGHWTDFSWFALRFELQLGYEHLFQGSYEGQARHSASLGYGGLIGFEMPLGMVAAGLDLGAGGRVFKLSERGWVHRLDLQLVVSLAWRLGG